MLADLKENLSKIFVFFVNGIKIEDESIDPEWSLLFYLRHKLNLTGTKLACGEGGCGACTVMVSRFSHHSKLLRHYTVNACLTPLASVHGMAVTTVEGIGSLVEGLHVVQERIVNAHGSQCGFCTPGMVMSMYTLLRNNPQPSEDQLQEYLTGNLCRCTGYRPIIEGFSSFTGSKTSGCGRSDCCQKQNHQNRDDWNAKNGHHTESTSENGHGIGQNGHLFNSKALSSSDSTQEVIFPPELKMTDKYEQETLRFCGPRVTYWRPTSLKELLVLKQHYPDSKIIAGNTEVGIEVRFKNQLYPVLINVAHISKMTSVDVDDSCVNIGAAVTLTDFESTLKDLAKTLPEWKTRSTAAFLQMLQYFAGKQIRNVASVGGNIMTSSPISDLNPVFVAVGASLTFQSLRRGDRIVPLDENFFTGYRKNAADSDEVLLSIRVPFTDKEEFIETYKQSRRRDDDIAIVNAAMKIRISSGSNVVKGITLVFGGMAETTIIAKETMKELEGREWDKSALEKGTSHLAQELTLSPSAPGGMVQYRRTLVLSFFFKFYLSVCHWLNRKTPSLASPLVQDELLATRRFVTPLGKGSQVFQKNSHGINSPVGKPLVHVSAHKQATGEAIYVDDLPPYVGELHAAFVFSTRAHAKIIKIDASAAKDVEGFQQFFSADDLPEERNNFGNAVNDEMVFRKDTVQCVGQVVGLVVAQSPSSARLAAKAVRVEYESLTPVITIQDAIEAKSWWGPWTIRKGNVELGFSEASHILEGEMYVGGQEHFYLEPNTHIAIPGEDGEIEVIATCQNQTSVQKFTSKALGILAHKVRVKIKRMGGGFGGKETRPFMFCVPVAVAASVLKRPVRVVLDRHEDMSSTGGRNPFLCRFKVGVDAEGYLTALRAKVYSNSGCTTDLSNGVVIKSISSIDNAYRHSNLEVTGYSCKTNLPSNTAFRGFGMPQAVMFMEEMMSRIAAHTGINPLKLREQNFYRSGDITHVGVKLENCNIGRCWSEVLQQASVHERYKIIQEFNRNNRYHKRGLAVIPLNYGIANSRSANQGGALVHIYTDGSVLITHGGIEMGQGLHTKMIQIAANVLEIPVDEIHIAETATDKVPNASSTAASICSDVYGMAVMNACKELMSRLKPYRNRTPSESWNDIVKAAYLDRVSLSCTGFHRFDGVIDYDFEKQEGSPYLYYTQGAAASEVEIDCLTGDHIILRTDIVMDVGKSLNPAIDIGQIEGAFMQGIGLVTLEELVHSPDGNLLTKGPGAYKIPGFQDIPREFHVSLLKDAPNPKAVYSSKAIGEPPLVLATSIFQALKSAIGSFREDQGLNPVFRLDSPATAERIRMACQDSLIAKAMA